jgi:tetratricopeptide (TPR) repeat protein
MGIEECETGGGMGMNLFYGVVIRSLFFSCALMGLFFSTIASASIKNHEESELLEKAFQHCPTASQERSFVDREKATEYYLQYIEEYPDSLNKAKVLSRIGMYYAQYRGEDVEPDYSIARKFLKQAIEADPDFVCHETQPSHRLSFIDLSG